MRSIVRVEFEKCFPDCLRRLFVLAVALIPGGNLAELLDRLSTLLRERIQFTGRVHALTAQGRGAATFLALWLPFIICLVWMLAPDYLRPLVENRWGHYTLAAAFGLDGLAYFMALRIADVEA